MNVIICEQHHASAHCISHQIKKNNDALQIHSASVQQSAQFKIIQNQQIGKQYSHSIISTDLIFARVNGRALTATVYNSNNST